MEPRKSIVQKISHIAVQVCVAQSNALTAVSEWRTHMTLLLLLLLLLLAALYPSLLRLFFLDFPFSLITMLSSVRTFARAYSSAAVAIKPLYTAEATAIGGRKGHVKSSDGM
jgi:hypothetical protein